jgi:hypothetical protein
MAYLSDLDKDPNYTMPAPEGYGPLRPISNAAPPLVGGSGEAWNSGPYGVAQSLADRISELRSRPVPDQPWGQVHANQSIRDVGAPAISVSNPPRGLRDRDAPASGPISGAAAAAPEVSESVAVPARNPFAAVEKPMTDAERNNAPFHEAYLRMQAEKRGDVAQAGQNQLNAQIRSERQAAIGDLAKAKREAEVASFRATNGADMVLAGGNPAYADQRKAIIADAATKQAQFDKLQQAAGNVTVPQDFARQAALTNQAGQEERRLGLLASEAASRTNVAQQNVNILGAQATVDIAGKKLGLEHQKQLADLGRTLGAETDPERARVLRQNILALLGKETKDHKIEVLTRKVKTLEGETAEPYALAIIGPDGKPEIVKLPPPPVNPATLPPGQYRDKNGQPFEITKDGQIVAR